MKKLVLLLAAIGSLYACGKKAATDPNTTTTNQAANNGGYTTVQNGNAKSLVGQKVSFDGTEAQMIEQHMMAGGPSSQQKEHFYIQPDAMTGLGQMVVYYSLEMVPDGKSLVNKRIRVYGTLQQMSGPGKGGGEHTETYLNLDKMEFLN